RLHANERPQRLLILAGARENCKSGWVREEFQGGQPPDCAFTFRRLNPPRWYAKLWPHLSSAKVLRRHYVGHGRLSIKTRRPSRRLEGYRRTVGQDGANGPAMGEE